MIPELQVSSIPQCNWNRHEDAFIASSQAIWCFKPTFIETHQASMMIYKEKSLKSPIKTSRFLEEIMTSSTEVYKACESGMAVGIYVVSNQTWNTAES